MDDIQNIEDFLALVRTGSFTRAADVRNVSQPAFTRRIKVLEQEIGAPLFDRSVMPIALTEAGLRFQSYAKNLSRTYRQALDETRAAFSHLKNPVRIAIPHTLALTVFPALWKDCLRRQPDMKVALSGQRTERCLSDLRDHHADLAIIHGVAEDTRALAQSGFAVQKLDSDPLLPVMAAHAGANANRLLSYAPDIALGDIVRTRMSEKQRAGLTSVFESPSSEVLKAMAMAGHGIAFLPRLLIEDEMRDGYLVPASPKLPTIPLDILLLANVQSPNPDVQIIWETARTRT